jgi:hypothetical protein
MRYEREILRLLADAKVIRADSHINLSMRISKST